MRPCAQTWPRACLDSTRLSRRPRTHPHTLTIRCSRRAFLPFPSPRLYAGRHLHGVRRGQHGAAHPRRRLDALLRGRGEHVAGEQAGRGRGERGRERGCGVRAIMRTCCRDCLPPHLSPRTARFGHATRFALSRPPRSAPSRTRSSPTARTCARVRARRPPARSQGTAAVRARLRPAARAGVASPPRPSLPRPTLSLFPARRLRHVARPQRRPHAPDPNHGRGCE